MEIGSGVIESKVFTVMFVFNLVEGFYQSLISFLPSFLVQESGYTAVELGVFNLFFRSLHYLFTPILFFIILYLVCASNLLDRIASILVSLILGSLVGFWIGVNLASSFVLGQWQGRMGSAMDVLYRLPYVPLGQMLLGFSVLAFFEINRKWKDTLSTEEMRAERPTGVTILSTLYVISAVLNFCAIPVVLLQPSLLTLYTLKPLILITLVTLLTLSGAGQILIAKGLHSGRKWGWIPAFISSATSLPVTATIIYSTALLNGFKSGLLTLSASIGLIISATIFFYLLSFDVRQYYGIVNPSKHA